MAKMNDRKIAIYLFIFLLSIYLLTASLRIDSGDGEAMYRVAYSLISGGGFAIPVEPRTENTFGPRGEIEPVELWEGGDGYGMWGSNNRYYARYGLGFSLLAAPFTALGFGVSKIQSGVSWGFATRMAVMFINPTLTAGACLLIYMLARRSLSILGALTIALMYGLCTFAWYYAKSAFSEPLVVFLLMLAAYLIENDKLFLAGSALGYMLITRQTALFLIIPILVWVSIRILKGNPIFWMNKFSKFLVPIIAGQLVVFSYNYYRFDDIFESGYVGITWDTPILLGIYSLLFSPGKGLLIFSPVLIVGLISWLYPQGGKWQWLSFSLFIFYLVPHAMFNHWSGGGGWGPRLLLPVVPILILSSGELVERMRSGTISRIILIILISISLVLQLLGVSVNWVRHLQRVYDTSSSPAEYTDRIYYQWRDSAIIGQVQSLIQVVNLVRNPVTRSALQIMISEQLGNDIFDQQTRRIMLLTPNVPDFWFIYLWFLRIHSVILAGMLIILGIIATFFGIRLKRVSFNGEM